MTVGVPKEIKEAENRVALTPAGAQALVARGHQVLVQVGAGTGSGLEDEAYARVGARLLPAPTDVFSQADLILKVKEPLPPEIPLLRPSQTVFTYFHLAPDAGLTKALLERHIVALAYETVATEDGRHPLLEPMSEVAGKMAVHVGAYYLAKPLGGRGVLLGGVPGVTPATVMILGGGIVGYNAARVAAGMGASVYLLDINPARLRHLDDLLPDNVITLISNPQTIERNVRRADLLVGAVYVTGAKAPRLVTREMVGSMKPGAVIVDVAVDQGGCVETTRPTTHLNPTYVVDGVVHYCVANMPGAFARTSTFALTNVTLPYALKIADRGWWWAARENAEIARGLNLICGQVTNRAVAETHGLPFVPWDEAAKTPMTSHQ
jgi:alanine dehydrogenase